MTFLMRAHNVLSPVSSHFTQLEVVRGEGCYLYDAEGRAYLDFSSGIGVSSTGHCHPKVVKAIQDQAATLIHGCLGVVYYETPIALAEKLGQILGHGLESVFFVQSGSEAIESAIKLAKYVTKKHKIVAFRGGFHGRTLGALSLTTSKEKYRDGYAPLLEGVDFFPYPYCYRCPWGKNRETCDTSCKEELASFFEQLDDQVAAVVVELVLGEGGYTPIPEPFLIQLDRLCRDRGILLIFDEIQTGFGKTGEWFAFQKYGVVPDIIALAKGIASGLPLGACVSTKTLMSKWTTGAHGGTYGGNPVTCAAGLATLEVLESEFKQTASLAKEAMDHLNGTLKNHPYIGDIRGVGMMIGVEFVQDTHTKIPAPAFMKHVMMECLKRGLIVISCGLHDNVIRLIPPLTIDEESLKKGLNIFTEVICGHYQG